VATLGGCLGVAVLAGAFANFVISCIALSESSVEQMVPACGEGVRVVVLLHVLFPLIGWLPREFFKRLESGGTGEFLLFWTSGLMAFFGLSTLLASTVASIVVAQNASSDANCRAALSEGSRYQAPVLAYLCYVYFALDCIALCSFCSLLYGKLIYSMEEYYSARQKVWISLAILVWFLGFGVLVGCFVNIVVLDLSRGPLVVAACGSGLWDAVMGQFIYFGVLPIAVVGVVGLVNEYALP
jgi:hypothetical protein